MMYKVSNCWLICEIKSGAKSTWPIRNMHLLPKHTSRFCQLWNWILERNVIYLLKTLLIGNSTLTVAKVLSRGKNEREIILRKKPAQIRYSHTHLSSMFSSRWILWSPTRANSHTLKSTSLQCLGLTWHCAPPQQKAPSLVLSGSVSRNIQWFQSPVNQYK